MKIKTTQKFFNFKCSFFIYKINQICENFYFVKTSMKIDNIDYIYKKKYNKKMKKIKRRIKWRNNLKQRA